MNEVGWITLHWCRNASCGPFHRRVLTFYWEVTWWGLQASSKKPVVCHPPPFVFCPSSCSNHSSWRPEHWWNWKYYSWSKERTWYGNSRGRGGSSACCSGSSQWRHHSWDDSQHDGPVMEEDHIGWLNWPGLCLGGSNLFFPFIFFLGFGKCIILDHFTKHTGK